MKAVKKVSNSKNSATGQKSKFLLDCTAPANDNIINPSGLEKFLQDRIKVDGKTGNLGTSISVTREKNKIHIVADIPFSKRYIKANGAQLLNSNKMEVAKTHGYSVLLRNLRYTTSEQDVKEVFERFGKIRDVYLPLDFNTKRPRGFGFVEFYQEEDAIYAVKTMDNATMDGNVITCCLAQDRRKSPNSMRKAYSNAAPPRRYEFSPPNARDTHRTDYCPRPRSRSRSPGSRYVRRSSSYDRRYSPHREEHPYYARHEQEHSPHRYHRHYPKYPRDHGDYRDYREHGRHREYGENVEHREYMESREHRSEELGRDDRRYPDRPHHVVYPGPPYDHRRSPPRRHEPPHPNMIPPEIHDMRLRRSTH
ncbi:Serine/arginine-rich SC35-like splicing factor SCL30A [Babesia sp. Xinjiang]|uniref:Serine/arginine-rich SC35-like splicing factor SCL30A n=1 Tax=Babesia sp. Xinjiang TaxID=462227 RepID=UPI000A235028|nr:Serine/arginine-rich SC35-like splicing factor SCL30A [Babesia sp. Xinjiang]ORM41451.1 Serine/arginine-rich SC35-like splicing factor SCL30A [Babesia sp. Xinjiang]